MRSLCLLLLFLAPSKGADDAITANFDADNYKIAERGKPLNITCTNNVNEQDINTWNQPSGDIEIYTSGGKTSTLYIPKVTKEHIGIYACEFTYSKDGEVITEKKEIQLIEKPAIDIDYIFESDRKINCKVDGDVDSLTIKTVKQDSNERTLLKTKHVGEDVVLTVGQDQTITYICEAFSSKAGNVTASLEIKLSDETVPRGEQFKQKGIKDSESLSWKNLICVNDEENNTNCTEQDSEKPIINENEIYNWVNIQEFDNKLKIISITKVSIIDSTTTAMNDDFTDATSDSSSISTDFESTTVEISTEMFSTEEPFTTIPPFVCDNKPMACCAKLLNEKGMHLEALKVYNDLIRNRTKTLGEYDAKTLQAMHNKGYTLNLLGRHEDALDLLEDVALLKNRALGENNKSTIKTYEGVAHTLNLLGCYSEAKLVQEEILKRIANI